MNSVLNAARKTDKTGDYPIDIAAVKRLANAVILNAVGDFMETYHDPERNGDTRECHRFLTGRTEIARFWFHAAGVPPMTGSRKDVYARIRHHRNDRMASGRKYPRTRCR
jgi:hypothetical protein